MALESIKCSDFRCLESAELELDPGNNLIYGPNASGKTSLLEAIAYLGRGRSFRGATTKEVIRHGEESLVVFGRVQIGIRSVGVGVRNSAAGLEIHVDNEKQASAAALAEKLPLQVVDPDVHKLIAGGPEDRRRYLDWITFHVEPGYLEKWRSYRRALRQRNSALRSGASALVGWDEELAALGREIDISRKRVLERTGPSLENIGTALLGSPIDFDYYQGWPSDKDLSVAIADGLERDLITGTTHVGPHRADIRLKYDARLARKLVSRGQQKLLASSLILAATSVVQAHLERPLLLLLDDPSAELDAASLSRLMGEVRRLDCQVVATTLEAEQDLFGTPPKLFHVEHGVFVPVR